MVATRKQKIQKVQQKAQNPTRTSLRLKEKAEKRNTTAPQSSSTVSRNKQQLPQPSPAQRATKTPDDGNVAQTEDKLEEFDETDFCNTLQELFLGVATYTPLTNHQAERNTSAFKIRLLTVLNGCFK